MMTRTSVIWMLLAALALGVSGCVSTSTGPVQTEASAKQAAKYNVELGVAYMRQGNRDLAMQKLQRAIDQNPDLPAAHTAIALLYEQIGDIKDADKHYRKALRINSDDPTTLNNYGAFLCRNGEPKKAEQYFVRAAKNPLYPTPEAAYTNAGICARQIPDLGDAEKYFRSALRINANFTDALWQMARLSFDQGKHLQTRAFLQRFMAKTDSMAPEVLWLAIRNERALGDSAAADKYGRLLVQKFPDSKETKLFLKSRDDERRG